LTQLSGQIFAPGNKPLFGSISKGGYNAPKLDGRGSLQKLRGRNQFAAKSVENRTLWRLALKRNLLYGCFHGFKKNEGYAAASNGWPRYILGKLSAKRAIADAFMPLNTHQELPSASQRICAARYDQYTRSRGYP